MGRFFLEGTIVIFGTTATLELSGGELIGLTPKIERVMRSIAAEEQYQRALSSDRLRFEEGLLRRLRDAGERLEARRQETWLLEMSTVERERPALLPMYLEMTDAPCLSLRFASSQGVEAQPEQEMLQAALDEAAQEAVAMEALRLVQEAREAQEAQEAQAAQEAQEAQEAATRRRQLLAAGAAVVMLEQAVLARTRAPLSAAADLQEPQPEIAEVPRRAGSPEMVAAVEEAQRLQAHAEARAVAVAALRAVDQQRRDQELVAARERRATAALADYPAAAKAAEKARLDAANPANNAAAANLLAADQSRRAADPESPLNSDTTPLTLANASTFCLAPSPRAAGPRTSTRPFGRASITDGRPGLAMPSRGLLPS